MSALFAITLTLLQPAAAPAAETLSGCSCRYLAHPTENGYWSYDIIGYDASGAEKRVGWYTAYVRNVPSSRVAGLCETHLNRLQQSGRCSW